MILTPPYHNLVAQAHNGTGKTTCFVLGMLSRVDPAAREPQALCLCPTRELVVQNVKARPTGHAPAHRGAQQNQAHRHSSRRRRCRCCQQWQSTRASAAPTRR